MGPSNFLPVGSYVFPAFFLKLFEAFQAVAAIVFAFPPLLFGKSLNHQPPIHRMKQIVSCRMQASRVAWSTGGCSPPCGFAVSLADSQCWINRLLCGLLRHRTHDHYWNVSLTRALLVERKPRVSIHCTLPESLIFFATRFMRDILRRSSGHGTRGTRASL
jgi:hypothetical protein